MSWTLNPDSPNILIEIDRSGVDLCQAWIDHEALAHDMHHRWMGFAAGREDRSHLGPGALRAADRIWRRRDRPPHMQDTVEIMDLIPVHVHRGGLVRRALRLNITIVSMHAIDPEHLTILCQPALTVAN